MAKVLVSELRTSATSEVPVRALYPGDRLPARRARSNVHQAFVNRRPYRCHGVGSERMGAWLDGLLLGAPTLLAASTLAGVVAMPPRLPSSAAISFFGNARG